MTPKPLQLVPPRQHQLPTATSPRAIMMSFEVRAPVMLVEWPCFSSATSPLGARSQKGSWWIGAGGMTSCPLRKRIRALRHSSESKMSSWRRRAYPAHARHTGRSKGGTHGGVLVAPKTGLQLAPMPKCEEQAWRIKGDDWSLIVIRATNVSFIKVAAYFTDSIGATGVNVKKMQQLAKAVMS